MAAKLKGKANDPFPGFDFGPMGVDLEDDERTRLATDPGHAQSYYTAFDKIRQLTSSLLQENQWQSA